MTFKEFSQWVDKRRDKRVEILIPVSKIWRWFKEWRNSKKKERKK